MRKDQIRPHLAILLALVFTSCLGEKNDLKKYYYPIEALTEGIVYEYQSVGPVSLEPEYWYFRSFQTDTADYLTGQYYNANFYVEQFFREAYTGNGSLMVDYILYEQDSTGQSHPTHTQILAPNGLPFEKADTNEVFLFKLRWKDRLFPGRTTTLIRNRRFKGIENWEWQNKKVKCAVFEIREIIETEEEGFQEVEVNGIEKYVEGVGLAYYEKNIGDALSFKYVLKDRYPMTTLEKKYKTSVQQQE